MSIQVALTHESFYWYDRPVSLAPQVIRLRPAPHCRTRVLSYSLKLIPGEHFLNWQQDPHGNYLARVVFPEKTRELKVIVDLVVEMAVFNPFDFFLEPHAERMPFLMDTRLQTSLQPYLVATPPTPLLSALIRELREKLTDRQWGGAGPNTIDYLVWLNRLIADRVHYLIRMEPGVQTPEETLSLGSGSCRDSAWLLIVLLRHLGLAARFVSGYLIQLVADSKSLHGPSGPTADFTDLHAWCEVYLPGAGWIGFDPTSGLLAGEGHIPLACSDHPEAAAPISGLVDPCEVSFDHRMAVTRLASQPRSSKPFEETTWQQVMSLGQRVDQALTAGDVRLTMGGEPTFIADEDRQADEWNTTALGPTKQVHGLRLVKALSNRFGEGGLLHMGQGKWYPGEALPRWALTWMWRRDGHPIWRNTRLLSGYADEPEQVCSESVELAFLQALCQRLGIISDTILPAYEDLLPAMMAAREVPVDAPTDPEHPAYVETWVRCLERQQALGERVGYVLPLNVTPATSLSQHPAWWTGPWTFRHQRLSLVPGDAPIGYRLPLACLPWQTEPVYPERDPNEPRLPLPVAWPTVSSSASEKLNPQGGDVTPIGSPRTALSVQRREGRLWIFIPPLSCVDHYLSLLQAIEEAASALNQPVAIEGYLPPRDERWQLIQVTPDPGVLEVNIHPAASWQEVVHTTETLYELAKQVGLSTEKFLIDGRQVGSGGGNHVVLGAATPANSPFLRRPDLLASLLRFWQNFPALSFLFSGQFIGPTSQAPRIDEARTDQVIELELALQALLKHQADDPQAERLWVVDRILRHVLVDATGNTHRAEFCIDKLYSPDSASGRQGLLEMRAFEMPPHPQMALVMQLFIRTCVAAFWHRPYRRPLRRWGMALHDQFMLPSLVWQNLQDALAELSDRGFDFPLDALLPQWAFRFPLAGRWQTVGCQFMLRNALEPWHVLGEESAPSGTVRYVDASLERLEVSVEGPWSDRYRLLCNGVELPLRTVADTEKKIAGVRFRAWQPWSCLHPTIPIDSPLTFEVYDTWSSRSIHGVQYHVMHPGGRNYETYPVNAFEAQARRLSRFVEQGHRPGSWQPVPAASAEMNVGYYTVDLRWSSVAANTDISASSNGLPCK